MLFVDLIKKKASKKALSEEEINYWIHDYTKNLIPDYQVASLLMAIKINGMTDDEIYYLTKAMIASGKVITLKTKKFKVDKHSTGGVGDTVTLILFPLLMALDFVVFKMSGAGLGITGGTLDKLDSIGGFNYKVHPSQANEILKHVNGALLGQSDEIAVADKKTYALRDVTGTVDSLPLIAASVISKKFAINNDLTIIDVKVGSGATVKTLPEAKELKRIMLELAKRFKRKLICEITNMNIPLGRAIGNAIEVNEAVKQLKSKYTPGNHLLEVVLNAAAIALQQRDKLKHKDAFNLAKSNIEDGSALKQFEIWMKSAGVKDISFINTPKKIFSPKKVTPIKATSAGYLEIVNAGNLGMANITIGAGKVKKDDKLDYHAGIYLEKVHGDKIEKGDTLFTIYSNRELSKDFYKYVNASYIISKSKPKNFAMVLDNSTF